MRSHPLLIAAALVLLLGASHRTVPAQTQIVGKACEPPLAVKQALQKLTEEMWQAPIKQRRARELTTLNALLKEHPGDLFIERRYQESFLAIEDNDPAQLIEEYRQRVEARPNDAVAHYLYAAVLKGRGTKEAIAQAEQALQFMPGLGRADQLLTEIYQLPAYRDNAKLLAHAKAFRDKCPASLSAYESLKQLDDLTEARLQAPKLRALLESSTEPEAATLYPTLWQIEFKLRPTSEHAEVRKQIEKDLDRLRSLKLVKSDQWFKTLRDGYIQTSNKEGELWVAEQMIVHHPNSMPAFVYFVQRWEAEHPRPQPSEPQEKRNAYGLLRYQAATEWTKRWPDSGSAWMERYNAIKGVAYLPRAEYDAEFDVAADGFMNAMAQNPVFGGQPPELVLAMQYVQGGRRLDYAIKLIERAIEEMEKRERHNRLSDQFPPTQQPRFYTSQDARWLGTQLMFDAYLMSKQLDKARATLAQQARLLEQMKPAASADEQQQARYVSSQSFYWNRAGSLAEAENRKLDAFAYYDNARRLRPKRDDRPASDKPDALTVKLQKLWQELGGTAEGWQAWLNRNEPSKLMMTVSGGGAWEKQQKPLPDFALTDLQGRQWRVSDLKGKVAFINLWATWCGPCVRELPMVQKLDEQMRGRPDVVVLTLNVDDEIGLIEPFVKTNKYTFPILLSAHSYLEKMNVYGIPRNWLISSEGTLQMEAVGFGSNSNEWLKKAVELIEQVKEKK